MSRRLLLWRHQRDALRAEVYMNIWKETYICKWKRTYSRDLSTWNWMSRRDCLWRHQRDKLCAQVHMNIYEQTVIKKTALYLYICRELKRRPIYLKKMLSRRVSLWRHQRDTPYAEGFIYISFFRRSFCKDIGLFYRSLLRVHVANTCIQTLIRCVIYCIHMLWFTTTTWFTIIPYDWLQVRASGETYLFEKMGI